MRHSILTLSLPAFVALTLSTTAQSGTFTFCAPTLPNGAPYKGPCGIQWTCPCPDVDGGVCDALLRDNNPQGGIVPCVKDLGGGQYECTGSNIPSPSGYQCQSLSGDCNPKNNLCKKGKWAFTPDSGFDISFENGKPVAKGTHAQCLGPSLQPPEEDDSQCRKSAGSNCPAVGGSPLVGDPIHSTTLASVYSTTDIQAGSLTLSRLYTRDVRTWAYMQSVGTASGRDDVAKPFGDAQEYGGSLHWTHNFYANVTVHPQSWVVRKPMGDVLAFQPCVASPCFARTRGDFSDSNDTLEFDGQTFTLHQDEGERLVFGALHPASSSQGLTRYFLSRIEAFEKAGPGQKVKVRATVTYAKPAACGSTAVPYIDTATSLEGTVLKFAYSRNDFGCVLDSVSVVAPGHAERRQVRYSYTDHKGRLAKAVFGPNGEEGEETYLEEPPRFRYDSEGWSVFRNGIEKVRHGHEAPDSYAPLGRSYDFRLGLGAGARNTPSQSNWNNGTAKPAACTTPGCQKATTQEWYETVPQQQTQADAYANFSSTFKSEEVDFTAGALVSERKRGRTSGTSQSKQEFVEAWQWAKLDNGPAVNTRYTDYRGNATAWSYEKSSTPTSGLQDAWELREEKRGVDAAGNALQSTRYGYRYFGESKRKVVSEMKRPSLLQSGADTTEYRLFDAAGRAAGSIVEGYTQVFDGTNHSTVKRYVGTFTFTSPKCSQGPEDVYGRTVEVHGPCFVDSANATDCKAGETIPVTQYAYYSDSLQTADRNRLSSVTRYPNATTQSCGAGLTQTFSSYDAYGHPRKVTDANGVETNFLYSGNLLSRQETAGRVTEYTYDTGMLFQVKHPTGKYTVYCHRDSPLVGGCDLSKPFRDTLQWQAFDSQANGTGYSAAVSYVYFADKRLRSETRFDETGKARQVVQHNPKEDGQPYWRALGKETSGFIPLAQGFGYDIQGNLVGISNGATANYIYGTPTPGCGGQAFGTEDKPADFNNCAWVKRDALGDVRGFEDMFSGATGQTCISRDANGNVSEVKLGCASEGWFQKTCAQCTRTPTRYVHDDFGQVVEFHPSVADVPTRYEYDARGLLKAKQTPSMVAGQEFQRFAYDGLGRMLQAVHTHALPSPGVEQLYAYRYDSAQVPANCPAIEGAQGRVAVKEDTFGHTYYRYSVHGEVLSETKLRHGATSCGQSAFDTLTLSRSFDAAGRLVEESNALGRRMRWEYTNNALRPSALSVERFENGASTFVPVLKVIRYAPSGNVSSYSVNLPGSPEALQVDYAESTDSAASLGTLQCPLKKPEGASKLEGIAAGVWVTRGNTPLYQRQYARAGFQIVGEAMCALDMTTPVVTEYRVEAQRLIHSYSTWKPNDRREEFFGHAFSNTRNAHRVEGWDEALTYSGVDGGVADRLLTVTPGANSSSPGPLQRYAYDAEGRVRGIVTEKKNGEAWHTVTLQPGTVNGVSQGGLDSVYSQWGVNRAVYRAYYDSTNRRRVKEYPTGARDEFFYSGNSQLSVDIGNEKLWQGSFRPVDEYVWLGDRPVLLLRGRLGNDYARQPDTRESCMRNGEARACGWHALVTDEVAKPVATVNEKGQLVGVYESTAFGEVGFRETPGVSAKSKGAQREDSVKTGVTLFQAGSLATEARLEGFVDTGVNEGMVFRMKQSDGGVVETKAVAGLAGRQRSVWTQVPAGATAGEFVYVSRNALCPSDGGVLTGDGGMPLECTSSSAAGVAVRGMEFRVHEVGATAFNLPLRFPGQYVDEESGLFENWNRYYEPKTGRYLTPEPLLGDSTFVERQATGGLNVQVYGYANGNPVRFVDPSGLDAYVIRNPSQGVIEHWAVAIEVSCTSENTCSPNRLVRRYDFSCSTLNTYGSLGSFACVFGAPKGKFTVSSEVRPLRELVFADEIVQVIPLSCEDTAAAIDRVCGELKAVPRYNMFFNSCQDFVKRAIKK